MAAFLRRRAMRQYVKPEGVVELPSQLRGALDDALGVFR